MSLMGVVADAACLIVDAPEASLDFLFAERAGEQLAEFAVSHPESRVIITSYLPSRHLVRSFLKRIRGERRRRERILNLIHDAAQNAALRADREKYDDFLDDVIKG